VSAVRGVVRCAGAVVSKVVGLGLLGLLRGWQLLASPTYGQTCRFYPSCSAYGVEAVRRHGPGRGSLLIVRRLARCHPWNPGGVDLVPPAGPAPPVPCTTQHDDLRAADLAGHHTRAPGGRRAA